jgi:hypothetical protein
MPPIPPGTPVINTANAGEAGIIVNLLRVHDGQEWYKVRFGNRLVTTARSSLVAVDTEQTLRDVLTNTREDRPSSAKTSGLPSRSSNDLRCRKPKGVKRTAAIPG